MSSSAGTETSTSNVKVNDHVDVKVGVYDYGAVNLKGGVNAHVNLDDPPHRTYVVDVLVDVVVDPTVDVDSTVDVDPTIDVCTLTLVDRGESEYVPRR